MAELGGEEVLGTGEGVGTSKEMFFGIIRRVLPDYPAEAAGQAVLCSLAQRVSGGVAHKMVEELSEDLRPLADRCAMHAQRDAPSWDKVEFYADVAEHLGAQAADVRRILSAVFSAIQSQITDATSTSIASQLPAELSGTWLAARRRIHPRPDARE